MEISHELTVEHLTKISSWLPMEPSQPFFISCEGLDLDEPHTDRLD